jgi:hypothetical protein
MNARETGGNEEVRFEDIDLVYIFPFDLGAPVEAEDLKKLLEWFSERYKMVEGVWIPPEEARLTPQFVYRKARELGIDVEKIGIEELMKNKELWEEINRASAMFRAIVSADELVFNPGYLELGRYARLKLVDLNVSIKDKELSYLNELKCELYLLLHSAGVGVLTAWIHLNGNFSTDDVIKIEKKLYYKAECTIKDPFGNIAEGTLYGFIERSIIRPLHVGVLFKGEYGSYGAAFNALEKGDITEDKIREKLRTPYLPIHRVVCIRKHSCNYKCETAEEAVERHLREIYGILTWSKTWRHARMDVIKRGLGSNLSSDANYAMFVATNTSLFMGSIMLDEMLKSVEDQELGYRATELSLVNSLEFLQLSDMILDVHLSIYRNKLRELRKKRRGDVRESLMEGLEEYNILASEEGPYGKIMKYGKERLGLSRKVSVLISGLQELRAYYEEETLREQTELSRKQVLLTILFGVFGAFQALEYLEPKLGFPYALAVTLTIFILIYLSYYKLYPYIRGKLHLFRRRRKAG